MGYKVKLQKVSRPTNNTFFVTVPVVLVETMELVKDEEFEWLLEDKNTLVLRRKNPMIKRKLPEGLTPRVARAISSWTTVQKSAFRGYAVTQAFAKAFQIRRVVAEYVGSQARRGINEVYSNGHDVRVGNRHDRNGLALNRSNPH